MGLSNLLFFNIGGSELFLILLVVLLLFGSKKIPELARGLGKGILYFKDATNEIQEEIKDATKEVRKEIKENIKEIK